MLYGFYAYLCGFIDGKKESLEIEGNILKESPFLLKVQKRYELRYLKRLEQISNLLEEIKSNSLQLLISLRDIDEENTNLLNLNIPNDPRKRERVSSKLAKLGTERANILNKLAEADQQEEKLENELDIFWAKIKGKILILQSSYLRGLSHSRKKNISFERDYEIPELDISDSSIRELRKRAIENAIMAKEGDGQHVSP